MKCDCKTDWLWVRSPLEEVKYLFKIIFSFIRSGVEVKCGVEFCHSVLPPEFDRKWGTECLNTKVPSAYSAVCGIKQISLWVRFPFKVMAILLRH